MRKRKMKRNGIKINGSQMGVSVQKKNKNKGMTEW